MGLDEVFKLVQDFKHGGSTHGMSKWETAAKCGRKANLKVIHRERLDSARRQEVENAEEVEALETGTYYHALQENGLRGQLEGAVWDQTDEAYNIHFTEAVRLFRGYQDAYGSALKRWGANLVGVEIPLGGEPGSDLALEIERRMGAPLTGRADAIIEIVDPAVALENTGLDLEPGCYLLDFKTAKQKNSKQDWQFTFGNQEIAYTLMYNVEHPEAPIKGFLFDLVVRHVKLRKEPELDKNGKVKAGKSFYAYLAQALDGDEAIIRALLDAGAQNMAADRANPAECFSGFGACPFFEMGICNRR